jgi:HlyD family secretion protein
VKIKKHWWFIGGGVLLVLFIVGGLARPKPGKKVQVAAATRQKLVSLVKAPAAIEPKTLVNVSAEVPGKIVRLAVEEGQAVKRGQLLLRLDPSSYEEDVRQAQAMMSSAEARLRGAKSTWDTAQPTHNRRKALYEQKLLSAGEMEAADREYQSSLSEYEAAREEVARTRAALRGARDRYAKTLFNSPIDGTITDLNVEEGEIVMTGTMNNPGTRILSVGDLDRMLAKADVDETDVIDLRVGQKATIEVDAFPDTTFAAHVSEIAHSAKGGGTSASSGETDFEVKVLFDDRVARVRPGMTADVSIETASKDSALAVPIQSVVTRSEEDLKKIGPKRGGRANAEAENAAAAAAGTGKKAKVKDKTGVFVLVAGKAEFREVTTGIASETDIEVSGNLKPGEQIITGPYQVLRDLKPGQRVIVEKAGARTPRKG